jgi:Ras-related protein Rab-4B
MFLETSALTGDHVEEAFLKCSRSILARIESGEFLLPMSVELKTLSQYFVVLIIGELDPERIGSGIQFGDATLKKIRQQQQTTKNDCAC